MENRKFESYRTFSIENRKLLKNVKKIESYRKNLLKNYNVI